MRPVFTTAMARERGLTPAMLMTGARRGEWRRIEKGIWVEGPHPPSRFDRAVGAVVRSGGVASGGLAGVLHDLDSVTLGAPPHVTAPLGRVTHRPGVRHLWLPPERIVTVAGIPCTDGLQTLVDLAPVLDDPIWEQALESGLRKQIVTISQLEEALPRLSRGRIPGTRRIRRVLLL
nr:type IV toxin-antitoxin system AbiEi family antitoxin domain-containing protein [Actinomycetota bacterium]